MTQIESDQNVYVNKPYPQSEYNNWEPPRARVYGGRIQTPGGFAQDLRSSEDRRKGPHPLAQTQKS